MSGWAKRWGARVLLAPPLVTAFTLLVVAVRGVYALCWHLYHGLPVLGAPGAWGVWAHAGFYAVLLAGLVLVVFGVPMYAVYWREIWQAARSPAKPKRPTEF